MGPYKHTPSKVRKTQPMTKQSKAAIEMAKTEDKLEMDQLKHDLSKAKTEEEKLEIRSRFLNRTSSQHEYYKKKYADLLGQTPRVKNRSSGRVSRKKGSKIMQGYKAGGKV